MSTQADAETLCNPVVVHVDPLSWARTEGRQGNYGSFASWAGPGFFSLPHPLGPRALKGPAVQSLVYKQLGGSAAHWDKLQRSAPVLICTSSSRRGGSTPQFDVVCDGGLG